MHATPFLSKIAPNNNKHYLFSCRKSIVKATQPYKRKLQTNSSLQLNFSFCSLLYQADTELSAFVFRSKHAFWQQNAQISTWPNSKFAVQGFDMEQHPCLPLVTRYHSFHNKQKCIHCPLRHSPIASAPIPSIGQTLKPNITYIASPLQPTSLKPHPTASTCTQMRKGNWKQNRFEQNWNLIRLPILLLTTTSAITAEV